MKSIDHQDAFKQMDEILMSGMNGNRNFMADFQAAMAGESNPDTSRPIEKIIPKHGKKQRRDDD